SLEQGEPASERGLLLVTGPASQDRTFFNGICLLLYLMTSSLSDGHRQIRVTRQESRTGPPLGKPCVRLVSIPIYYMTLAPPSLSLSRSRVHAPWDNELAPFRAPSFHFSPSFPCRHRHRAAYPRAPRHAATMGSEFGVTPDTKPELRLDSVGVFWIVFAVAWTVVLLGGMLFLHARRDMPILRIRGLSLSFAAVAMLHCYWFAVTTGYVYGPLMPEVAEYWIMGIWFPFGIALFHASNSRFLYVANAQKKYVEKTVDLGWDRQRPRIRKTLAARWRLLDYSYKMLLLVGLGMAFHLFTTVFMYLISRKFHSSFGIPGTEVTGTAMEKKSEQGRGWEWWPSVFWQLFWAWIVAPIILWRARGLRDTQGWRTQTIACCISGLHAAPMWLIALYVPGMAPVNNYFIPPQWIAVSIMMIEVFTVFVPCWEVRKQQSLCQETLDSIARWESRQRSTTHGAKPVHSGSSGSSSWMGRTKAGSIASAGNGSILTMDALEHTLAKNPEPLQNFSALRDFSGENIAFLTRVREWRATYLVPGKDSEKDSEKGSERDSEKNSDSLKSETDPSTCTNVLSRECYESALRIYMDFVSSNSAEFQVNLSSQDFKNLQAVFEPAARDIYGEGRAPDPATPFDDAPRQAECAEIVRYWGEIPEGFTDTVFDDSEMSIKYLVLTNTWPKFIKERRSFDSVTKVESGR
ncbi:Uncharacterized protein TCAP_00692, partial [Tolypocladium capitatum]